MKGILMLLKSFGVNITPETAAQIESTIPRIPAMLNELLGYLKQNEERAQRMEAKLDQLLGAQNGRTNSISDAPDATGRSI